MSDKLTDAAEQKRCFVVMGFGIKTDFATGRKLDLNKSYRLLIKPVVEGKQLLCIRADEIQHSGMIDTPMYQELLKADVVIADLSTANLNAFYELGVRHALRPRTTIVISEDKLPYPFDLNHVKITNYTHLGDAIDFEEVERFRKVLGDTLEAVLMNEEPDSPVYTFLHELIPPSWQQQAAKVVEKVGDALQHVIDSVTDTPVAPSAAEPTNPTLAVLMEQGEKAIRNKDYSTAKTVFQLAAQCSHPNPGSTIIQNPYLVHRLALATYKAQVPDTITALKEAMKILAQLDLDHTNDPETVALAGAIEKQLFEKGEGDDHLANAILYYERGYYLLNNRQNGINLAFLLNCRADSSLDPTPADKIADLVYANRTRRRVLTLCTEDWDAIMKRPDKEIQNKLMLQDAELSTDYKASESAQKFWILANKAEAYFGLGELAPYQEARAAAEAVKPAPWMLEAFDQQVTKLGKLREKYGHLLGG